MFLPSSLSCSRLLSSSPGLLDLLLILDTAQLESRPISHLLLRRGVDGVSVDAENEPILLDPAVDDDHDYDRDDEEE